MIRKWIVILSVWPLIALAQDAEMEDFAARLASQAKGKGTSVAVIKFTNEQGYDAGFSKYLADRLTRLLVSRGAGLQLQNHAQVQTVSRDLGLHYEDGLNTAAIKGLAGKLGVDLLIAGSYAVTQRSVTVDASIIDAKTGNMVGAQSVRLNHQDVAELLVKANEPASAAPAAAPAPAGPSAAPPAPANPAAPAGGGGVDARRVAIPAQTAIHARVLQNLSSAGLRMAQKLVLRLADPIAVDGFTVANPEAEVDVTVMDVGQGRLRLHLETVKMFDGTVVPVRASDYQATASKSSVIGSILFRKNNAPMQIPPVQIPANTVLTFTTQQDTPWH